MATTSWQAFFFRIWNFPLFSKSSLLFEVNFTFLVHFRVNLLISINFWSILEVIACFWRKQEFQDGGSKMAAVWEQNVIVRHKTSSADVAYLNGNVFGRTICCHSFNILGVKRWRRFQKTKKPRCELRVNINFFVSV